MAISVEEALEKILSSIRVLEAEEQPILDCLDRVLAEDVHSDIDVPPLDNSAMDGYAVRAQDIAGASSQNPVVLRVIDTIIAGGMPGKAVEPGTAIRIMTGAPMPADADCIVKFEDTDETERAHGKEETPAEIGIMAEEKCGANVRHAGESVARGSLVLAKGTVVRPSEIGVLASLGRARANVIRRPVVAVLATGNELVDPGKPLQVGKLYNSNSYSIAAQILRYGGIPKLLGIARDNEASLVNKLHRGRQADLFITIGGVSMGDYDMVKNVLAKQGEIVFWQVRTKPGKPLAFGTIRGTGKNGEVRNIPQLGLAGNSVSCMINFELFARPAILKMMGRTNLAKPSVEATIGDRIDNRDGRRIFARVKVEKRDGSYYARLTGPQGSGILSSMILANGLAVVPEEKKQVVEGDKLQVMMLDWNQDI